MNLLIKLNDVVVDISSCYDRVMKQAVEFFLGRMVHPEDLNDLKKQYYGLELVKVFLEKNGLYLRDAAIRKKLSEYFVGKDFNGLIDDCKLNEKREVLEKLSKKNKIILLSFLSKDETKFLVSKHKLNSYKVILSDSADKTIKNLKKETDFTYVGNELSDYEACVKNKAKFIGYNIDLDVKKIKRLEELL